MIAWSLFCQFLTISLLAYGGGMTISLMERVAVREQRWVDDGDFAAAFALGQATPGPVLVIATFIGYRAAGVPGALAATLGAFLVPWVLGVGCDLGAVRFANRTRFRGFTRGATAASIGLLITSAVAMIRHAGPVTGAGTIAAIAFLLAWRTEIHPLPILIAGAAAGAVLGLPAR